MKEDLEKVDEAGDFSSAEEWQEKTGHIRKRKRKKTSRNKKKSKPEWEKKSDSGKRSKQTLSFWIILVCLMIIVSLLVGGFAVIRSTGETIFEAEAVPSLAPLGPAVHEDDSFSVYLQESERVARAFLSEVDEEKRLTFVRDVEEVHSHLDQYPEDARKFSIVKMKMMGYGEVGGVSKCAYSVQLSNGNYRVLTVLNTEDGLKVDWDGYARYCSATWDDLFSGQVKQAEVRVFIKPGDHAVAPFADASQWTCFQMVSSDDRRPMFVYARAGSHEARQMLASVMKSKRSRQHVTLLVKDLEGSAQQGLFVVEELLAMGWVKP